MRLSPLTTAHYSLSPHGSHSSFPPNGVCMCVVSFENSAGVIPLDLPRPVVKSGKTELDWQHLIRSKYKAAWEIASSYCFPFPAVHKKIRKQREARQDQHAVAAPAALGWSPCSPNAHLPPETARGCPVKAVSQSFWHHKLLPCSDSSSAPRLFSVPASIFGHSAADKRKMCVSE